jgi:hypothetical protein
MRPRERRLHEIGCKLAVVSRLNHGRRERNFWMQRRGVRYRYYVSTPCLHGEAKTASAGSVPRVPAADIEDVIVKSLKKHLAANQGKSATATLQGDRGDLAELVAGIVVHRDRLMIRLKSDNADEASDHPDDRLLTIPWHKPPAKRSTTPQGQRRHQSNIPQPCRSRPSLTVACEVNSKPGGIRSQPRRARPTSPGRYLPASCRLPNRERTFWMQRQGAQNLHKNARPPPS